MSNLKAQTTRSMTEPSEPVSSSPITHAQDVLLQASQLSLRVQGMVARLIGYSAEGCAGKADADPEPDCIFQSLRSSAFVTSDELRRAHAYLDRLENQI